MASGLSSVVVLALCVFLSPHVSGHSDCEGYTDYFDTYHSYKTCYTGSCCGTCNNRYCCTVSYDIISESQQDACVPFNQGFAYSSLHMIIGVTGGVAVLLISICCCVCPYCCLYKLCRKPRPVIATTTVMTTTAHQHPPQPVASHGQPQPQYQYQPVPVQPGYGSQPMSHGYGAQPMPYQAQPVTPGPPPSYQEANQFCPAYPPNPMPYSQAAFTPNHPTYPLQPPTQPTQPNAPPAQLDFLSQPAYNPDYLSAPPNTG